MIDFDELPNIPRTYHRKLVGELKQLRNDASRHPSYVAEQSAKRCAAVLAEASARVAGPLLALTEREGIKAAHIPGEHEGAAARVVANLRAIRKLPPPDPTRLARTSPADIERMARDSSDPVLIDELRRDVAFRVSQGATDLEGLAATLSRRLDEAVLALPEVRASAAELERMRIVRRNVELSLAAIGAGSADDPGVREDLYRECSRRIESGEWTKDQVRQVLNGEQPTASAAA